MMLIVRLVLILASFLMQIMTETPATNRQKRITPINCRVYTDLAFLVSLLI